MSNSYIWFSDVSHTRNVTVLHQNELSKKLLTPECLQFLATLQRLFNKERLHLLNERVRKSKLYDDGTLKLDFLKETSHIREGDWQVAQYPEQLQQRWVEITGPPNNAKWVINALNSGADVYMADFEDSLSPTFENLLKSQLNLIQVLSQNQQFKANLRTLEVKEQQKEYKLNPKVSTLFVRTRGWHLDEKHLLVDGEYMSGSLFDFGVYMFHNLQNRIPQGGVFYYFPKLQSYLEARLWNKVCTVAETYFNVPIGTVRCTILIETIEAGLQMEEILYELRTHIVGLNAGRWDYIFSIIKIFKNQREAVLPDRVQITMTTKFMKSYSDLLVKICHKRGAHAIGGMAAFIPSRTDKNVNEQALKSINESKARDVKDGYDGTWVAHPDLVAVARGVFDTGLKGRKNQKEQMRQDVNVNSSDLTNFYVDGGFISEKGIKGNINICIQYIYYWLSGTGAVGLANLMEDAATAEISRSQIWQWRKFHSRTNEGVVIDDMLLTRFFNEEISTLEKEGKFKNKILFDKTLQLVEKLIFGNDYLDFFTIPAYETLINLQFPKL